MEKHQVDIRKHIVIVSGGIQRALTDEEWAIIKPQLDSGEVVIKSHTEEMKKHFEELFSQEIFRYQDFKPIEEANHHWKKSTQRKHPAFRR